MSLGNWRKDTENIIIQSYHTDRKKDIYMYSMRFCLIMMIKTYLKIFSEKLGLNNLTSQA